MINSKLSTWKVAPFLAGILYLAGREWLVVQQGCPSGPSLPCASHSQCTPIGSTGRPWENWQHTSHWVLDQNWYIVNPDSFLWQNKIHFRPRSKICRKENLMLSKRAYTRSPCKVSGVKDPWATDSRKPHSGHWRIDGCRGWIHYCLQSGIQLI